MLKTRIEFVNGSTIESFPNAPENVRGETCSLLMWHEASFIADAENLYDATVYSLATTGGRFIATSTPGSRDSLFYRFCMDDEQYSHFSRHHVSYVEALEPNGPLKKEILEKLRAQCAEDPWRWRREMEAEFAEDEEAWLSMSLINSCVDPDLEYLSDEQIDALPDIVTAEGR